MQIFYKIKLLKLNYPKEEDAFLTCVFCIPAIQNIHFLYLSINKKYISRHQRNI